MWADDRPRWVRLRPRWAEDSAMWADDRPRWVRLRPTWAEDSAMWAGDRPRWARLRSRWPEDSAMWADGRPRWIRLRPRWAEDSVMWAEDAARWAEHVATRLKEAADRADRRFSPGGTGKRRRPAAGRWAVQRSALPRFGGSRSGWGRSASCQPGLDDRAHGMHDHVDHEMGEDRRLQATAHIEPAEGETHGQDDQHRSQGDD